MKPVLKKRVTQKALLEPLQNIIERQEAELFCLKSVIDNFPGSVYWKDEKGVYLGRNQYSVEKMQSLQLEPVDEKYDVTGKTDYDLFPKTVADCYRKHDQEVMKSREELTVEEPMILPNGKTIVQLSTKQPLFNENGGVIGIIGNTVDITQIKKMEAQLKKAREKQAKAQRALIDCAARVSHDIQSPLAALNTVLRNVPVMPEDQRILIRNAVRRINDIANNLLSEYRDEIKNIETAA